MTKTTTTITTDEIISALAESLARDVDRIDAATKPAHSREIARVKYRPTESLHSLKAFIEKAIGFASAAELRAAGAELKSVDAEVASIHDRLSRNS